MESLAQIRAMSALASKLNRLNDVSEIGETIAVELRAIVDYQNARIYLLEDDDETLEPIAFRGDMEYEGETLDALRTVVGEGITGMAAATGRTLNVADANACEYAVDIPGTDDADESILAVPLRYDGRTIGVVVLSKLGFDQFSQMAVRLVELLAAQAAVALENARLFAAQRRTAAAAAALLAMAAMAADERSTEAVATTITRTACSSRAASPPRWCRPWAAGQPWLPFTATRARVRSGSRWRTPSSRTPPASQCWPSRSCRQSAPSCRHR